MSLALHAAGRSLDGIYHELMEQFYDLSSELRNGKVTSNVKSINITFELHQNDDSAENEFLTIDEKMESSINSQDEDAKDLSLSALNARSSYGGSESLMLSRRSSSNIARNWMRYDGCQVKTRNSSGQEKHGLHFLAIRLNCVFDHVADRRSSCGGGSNKESQDNDQRIRALKQFVGDKERWDLVQGPECAIRVRRSPASPSDFASFKGHLLLARGKPVGVRAKLETAVEDLTLHGFLELAVARTGGPVLEYDERFGGCPCAEWEGVCSRCTQDMVSYPCNFPERKIRVHVVDDYKGTDCWAPLHQCFPRCLLTLQSFCAINSMVTSAPMHAINLLIGDGSLPPGWTMRSSENGVQFKHDMLQITTSKHPGYVEKTLAEVQMRTRQGTGETRHVLTLTLVLTVDLPSSFTSPTAISPRPVRPMTAIPRRATVREPSGRPLSALSANQLGPSQVRRLSSKFAASFDQSISWRGDSLHTAARVFRPDRTFPPYSHQAFSSAMLLQSVFRGHMQRLFLLVKFRRLSAVELPVSLAYLAHRMIGYPTTLRMYKRLTVYYVKHSNLMQIPQDFGWPKRVRISFMRSAMLVQLAVRCHFARNAVRDRIREVDYAASRKTSVKEIGHQSIMKVHTPVENTFSQTLNLSPSMSLNAEEKKCLEEGIRQSLSPDNLIFLASKENWNINILHSALENLENIFFLASCRTRKEGNEQSWLMGAFTSIPWSRYGGYKTDPDAFLFSFQTKDADIPRFVKCPLSRHAGFSILHSCTLQLIDGKFYDSGIIFGRGPDLFLDLRNRTKCLLQLGATYSAPDDVEGSEWLRISTSFETTELAVFADSNKRPSTGLSDELAVIQREDAAKHSVNDSEHGPAGPEDERQTAESRLNISKRLRLNEVQVTTLLDWTGCASLSADMLLFLASRDGFDSELLKSPLLSVRAPLLVLVSVDEYIFGCFSSRPAGRRKSIDPTSESFLFRLKPAPTTKISKVHREHPGVEIIPGQCIACGERGADM
eukprot:764490-Hanusia_phi.AAC.4